jgi:hypothetical protein
LLARRRIILKVNAGPDADRLESGEMSGIAAAVRDLITAGR